MNRLFLALGASLLAAMALAQDRSTAAAGAEVYFIAPRDGATVRLDIMDQGGTLLASA